MIKKSSSFVWIVLAIASAAIIGLYSNPHSTFIGIPYIQLSGFLGQLFLNGLTLLVVPLVSSSIIYGISQMSHDQSFKRLGAKTFFFYSVTTLLAVLTALLFVNVIQPGRQFSHAPYVESLSSSQSTLSLNAAQSHADVIGQIFLKIIPTNLFEAASSGNMLGIIFFSLFFGFSLAQIDRSLAQPVSDVVKGVFNALMKMTHFFMRAMPIGVFCLVVKAMTGQASDKLFALLSFFMTVVISLSVFMLLILPALLKAAGIDPIKHFKAMAPALITAFSTSSSAATLPITMECVEKRAGVSNKICSFVIPLGTSVNMAGSALYECAAILFIAQLYGIHLTITHQAIVVFLSLLTSMGIAGIPSGGLVAILIVLNTMGLPAEGLALILPMDRILDMCRTLVNVFSDTSCAVLVAHTEGEKVLEENYDS
ncbi:dicarboxylate/amino acid:cation symporter [Rhabdochlamydiaceae symbiont of Dictyostelium giganteum]|uniref:dicarboxylate/amino acid:cation symporter n=1 Tax=Rhabdochlamydiaceae symbiont of Dictyostelium giganteum TaxID=3342349 RepID=UPI00384CED4B